MKSIPEGDFLLLVDASAYIHRAYHAATKTVRRIDNQETGAIISFSWAMMNLCRLNRSALKRRPTHAAIVLDYRQGSAFRKEIFPQYKGQRPSYEAGLESQLPFLPAIAEAFNIPCLAIADWEADDIIATYADAAPRQGLNVVIASSDKDFCQLVSDKVFLYDAMKDKDADRFDNSDKAIIDMDAVRNLWGVFPWQMVDLQALVGDTVDNVPGVPGIGPKTAAQLLRQFNSVEDMIEAADFGDVDGFKNTKQMELIADHIEEIRLSKRLVELARNVPVPFDIADLRLKEAHPRKLKEFFLSIEAPQLERRVDF